MEEMKLSADVEYILDKLACAGYRADVVGGAVRDHLLGIPSYDYDITTAATPDEVKTVFSGCKTVDTGIKHGTVTLVLEGGNYEITTWRVDGDYLDNRHPESVTFTRSLDEDLARRDFTINAICYNPKDGYTDLYGGIEDLKQGIIRAVGEPDRRFDEDALRIMRAVRFAATLGFRLERETARAAIEKRALLNNVSVERIYSELKRLLSADHAYMVLKKFSSIILTVLPEIKKLYLPDKDDFKIFSYDHRLLSLFYLGAPRPIESYSAAMKRLKTDRAQRILGERALDLVIHHKPFVSYYALKFLEAYGKEVAEVALGLGLLVGRYSIEAECRSYAEVLYAGLPYSVSQLAIGGGELIELGLSGKEVGVMLRLLLDSVMHGWCQNTRESLIDAFHKIKSGELKPSLTFENPCV